MSSTASTAAGGANAGAAKSNGRERSVGVQPTAARAGTGLRGSAANGAPEGAVQRGAPPRADGAGREDGRRQSRNGRRGASGARGAAEGNPAGGRGGPLKPKGRHASDVRPLCHRGKNAAGGASCVADTRGRYARGALPRRSRRPRKTPGSPTGRPARRTQSQPAGRPTGLPLQATARLARARDRAATPSGFEGHSTDPRPVSDALAGGSAAAPVPDTGGTPGGTPATAEAVA